MKDFITFMTCLLFMLLWAASIIIAHSIGDTISIAIMTGVGVSCSILIFLTDSYKLQMTGGILGSIASVFMIVGMVSM